MTQVLYCNIPSDWVKYEILTGLALRVVDSRIRGTVTATSCSRGVMTVTVCM